MVMGTRIILLVAFLCVPAEQALSACSGQSSCTGDVSACQSRYSLDLPPIGLQWPVDLEIEIDHVYAHFNSYSKLPGQYHTGLDIPVVVGTRVRAAAAGKARRYEYRRTNTHGLGNVVIAAHDNGYYTLYAHLDDFDDNDIGPDGWYSVAAGQGIANSGNTPSVPAHLHFELKRHLGLGEGQDSPSPHHWGYTPCHPDEYGYVDPLLFLDSTSLHSWLPTPHSSFVQVTLEGDGIGQRVGPGAGGYFAREPGLDLEAGEVYASSHKTPSTEGCADGWLRLLRVDQRCHDDSLHDKDCMGSALPAFWACLGNGDEKWLETVRSYCQPATLRSGLVSATSCTGGPPNDHFEDRIEISGSSGGLFGSNVDATAQAGEPPHDQRSAVASVWWRWTAPADGSLRVTTAGANFDTVLAAYRGSTLGNLLLHTWNDDDGSSSFTSTIAIEAEEGEKFNIAVDGYRGAVGEIELGWVFHPAAQRAPLEPSSVSASDGTYASGVEIWWSERSGADTYLIERADSPGRDRQQVGSTSEPPFFDSSVATGFSYAYWVVACNSAGCSDPSPYDEGYALSPGAGPDLVMDAFAARPTRLDPGEDFSASARVENIGDAPSPETYVDYILWDNDDGHAGIILEDDRISPRDPSTATSTTERFDQPSVPGDYWIGACIRTFSGEGRSDNNCSGSVHLHVFDPICVDDVNEPDDTCESARSLTGGSAFRNSLCDVDWMRFTVTEGATYRIETSNLSLGTDTTLSLQTDLCDRELAFNDDFAGMFAAQIEWTAEGSGPVRVGVGQSGSDYDTAKYYDLHVVCVANCTTCNYSPRVVLNGITIGHESFHGACDELVTEGLVAVTRDGSLTLKAGERVVLGSGFRVESGGRLEVAVGQNH